MSLLPFVTEPELTTTDEIVELGTKKTGTIKILKKGGLSYNETQAFNKAMDGISTKFEREPTSSNFQLLLKTVSLAFQQRVQQFADGKPKLTADGKPIFGDAKWGLDDTIKAFDENQSLFNLIYDFMIKEKNGWNINYETKIEGRDAQLIAENYASDNGLIAASNGKEWFIFKDKQSIPSDCFIPGEEFPKTKGKEKN